MTPAEPEAQSVTLADVAHSFDNLAAELHQRNAWRRVVAVLVGLAIVILLAVIAVLLVIALSNRTTLGIVQDVTDPEGKFARRSAAAQQVTFATILDEGDCRHRRAQAGLPPPPQAYVSCRAQTPPEVYDGPSLVPPSTVPAD